VQCCLLPLHSVHCWAIMSCDYVSARRQWRRLASRFRPPSIGLHSQAHSQVRSQVHSISVALGRLRGTATEKSVRGLDVSRSTLAERPGAEIKFKSKMCAFYTSVPLPPLCRSLCLVGRFLSLGPHACQSSSPLEQTLCTCHIGWHCTGLSLTEPEYGCASVECSGDKSQVRD